ncbi:MAG: hypothetical protein KF730_10695 [Sphingomonas sp.]|uniref:hypothetical protein n=1 Tax=Sphingomonas sp. TaxID=28214 RepID=UPI0025CCA4C1|nr:hypothetical protein [Sphingomonas sp.]MBX3565030.1 hypothetical protein [Sphingomonas sp.]
MFDPALTPILLTIAVLAMFALVWGGARLLKTDRTKGILMMVCALVILGNLLILRL